MNNDKECALGAANEAKIEGLENTLAAFKEDFRELRKVIESALKRPSYAMMALVTTLSSVCVGLTILLITKGT